MGFFKRMRVMLGLASKRDEEKYDPSYETEESPKAEAERDYVPVRKRTHIGTGSKSRRPQRDARAQGKPPSQGH
jgi:FtsZ-interacting cell division protein YlmF